MKVGWENNIAIETYAMLLHNSIRNSARLTPRAFDFRRNHSTNTETRLRASVFKFEYLMIFNHSREFHNF